MVAKRGDLTKEMGDAITELNSYQDHKHERQEDVLAMNNDIDGGFEFDFLDLLFATH